MAGAALENKRIAKSVVSLGTDSGDAAERVWRDGTRIKRGVVDALGHWKPCSGVVEVVVSMAEQVSCVCIGVSAVCLCPFVRKITQKHVNGCRPNLV